jgi:hypothetical protein
MISEAEKRAILAEVLEMARILPPIEPGEFTIGEFAEFYAPSIPTTLVIPARPTPTTARPTGSCPWRPFPPAAPRRRSVR